MAKDPEEQFTTQPNIEIDDKVREHTNSIDIQTLRNKGFTRLNFITATKINRIIAHAVVKGIEKYRHQLGSAGRGAHEPPDEAAAEDGRFSLFRTSVDDFEDLEVRIRSLVAKALDDEISRRRFPGSPESREDFGRFKEGLIGIITELLERQGNGLPGWAAEASSRRTVFLERRLEKLKKELLEMEISMERMGDGERAMDPGLASVYTEVQGLNRLDRQYQTKKGMLEKLFEENLRLQSKDPP